MTFQTKLGLIETQIQEIREEIVREVIKFETRVKRTCQTTKKSKSVSGFGVSATHQADPVQ